MNYDLQHGDCLDVLRGMADNSVDAIVTDPPYGLSFMGKRWDYDVPSEDIWRECLRVLKPGGHLLAFAGTRTQHRMAVRIEDAGFEIRDMIAWVYGSGFPKSLDVSKAIDKRGGAVAGFKEFRDAVRAAMQRNGVSRAELTKALGNHMLSHYLTAGSQPAVPNVKDYRIIRHTLRLGHDWDHLFAEEAEREVVGTDTKARSTSGNSALPTVGGEPVYQTWDITAPATPEAKQWYGWGTALKPALEPITVARKPLIGTVAENVLTWGTGGMNVDGCRVEFVSEADRKESTEKNQHGDFGTPPLTGNQVYGDYSMIQPKNYNPVGRWPANLIHDGSEEVVGLFPETKTNSVGKAHGKTIDRAEYTGQNVYGKYNATTYKDDYADSGSAARFFYCAKASKRDRDEGCEGMERKKPAVESAHSTLCVKCNRQRVNVSGSCQCHEPEWVRVQQTPSTNHHPTVKPTDLMRYLCRLVTPPGGTVLDPFMGSGSTGKAAVLEGFNFIGIEREAEYLDIARARIAHADGGRIL